MSGSLWVRGRVPATREYGGVLIIEAILNGVRKGRLIADTGAALTGLTRTCLQDAGIDVRRPEGRKPLATAQSTELVTVPTFKLQSLEVGAFRMQGLVATLLELPPELRIDGVLGVNFLERFRSTFDFPNHHIILRGPASS